MPKANDPDQLQDMMFEAMRHARSVRHSRGLPIDIRITADADQTEVRIASPDGSEHYARVFVDPQGVAHWQPLPKVA